MYERELIERYHGRLTAAGVTGYSLETLMADYVPAPKRGQADRPNWPGRLCVVGMPSLRITRYRIWWNLASDLWLAGRLKPAPAAI
jgi:hypothetical protein